LTLSYFHRRYYDLTGTANVLVPATAYNAVTISNPLTGAPLTVYNQSAATTGQSRRVIDNYPGIENGYNGFEVVLDKRFANNATALIAYTYGVNQGTQTTSDLNNPNVIRASLGTVFSVPCCTSSFAEVQPWIRASGLAICAAKVDASTTYFDFDFTQPTAIVLGSEASGLSTNWFGDDVRSVRIPLRGSADSLNVSVAAAVLIYEALRQRRSF
jgi:tRNA(Leu) C34 or U34 (ribose-2'-O)-methylase TrmL